MAWKKGNELGKPGICPIPTRPEPSYARADPLRHASVRRHVRQIRNLGRSSWLMASRVTMSIFYHVTIFIFGNKFISFRNTCAPCKRKLWRFREDPVFFKKNKRECSRLIALAHTYIHVANHVVEEDRSRLGWCVPHPSVPCQILWLETARDLKLIPTCFGRSETPVAT